MNPGPTFDRVYDDLKQKLSGGEFAPGQHLDPSALGEALHSSITPVRDALHRLVGERLVETPRNDGFRVPVLTEAELRDLYAWNGNLLELALRRKRASRGLGGMAGPVEKESEQLAADAAALFLRLARLSGSGELEAAVEQSSRRLGAARRAEEMLFDDLSGELSSLALALRDEQRQDLRRLLAAYHRRRQRWVPALLVAMRRRHQQP